MGIINDAEDAMKTYFDLGRDGYVVNFLTTRPALGDFEAPYELKDQLEFERQMREIYYREPSGYPCAATLGECAPNGERWIYYTDNRNPYVDFSKFYFTLTEVTFPVMTTLVSDKARRVRARVWSYAAFDMWCGGEHVAREKVPVYQPIRYTDVTLELKAGENDVFILVQNFGVRDTRNMISLQILDADGITVTLPVEDKALATLAEAEEWFARLVVRDGALVAPRVANFSVDVTINGKTETLEHAEKIELGDAFRVMLTATVLGQSFKRVIERYECRKPERVDRGGADPWHYLAAEGLKNNNYYGETAESMCQKHNHGVVIYTFAHVLECGGKYDDRAIADVREELRLIDKRGDCSDFILSVILHLYCKTDMPDFLKDEVRKTALGFRYWMDENGADAMCFWSENHALTFYSCQYIAGMLFPDDTFLRSGRTGREQMAVAERRIREWLDVIETEGYEEFCAGGYLAVTAIALMFVYDHCTEELRERARLLMDDIARQCAVQCFHGLHLAPMGRVYRGALVPFMSSVQSLLFALSDENIHFVYSKLALFALSDYRFPDVTSEMRDDVDVVFNSGRAEIHTKKTKNYMLTSVASPRESTPPSVENTDTEYFRTKVMNESFHGTSLFTPGGNGYQQHLWYAALSDSFYTFVNLPGTERDMCEMRPGYWYGNLVFPAQKQIGNELFVHYDIPERVPTKFTHAYFPAYAADEVVEKAGFRFARVGDGYLALWCSEPLVLWEADAVVDADLRAYGDRMAWYVRVGSKNEDGSFDDFCNSCIASGITYDKVVNTLK